MKLTCIVVWWLECPINIWHISFLCMCNVTLQTLVNNTHSFFKVISVSTKYITSHGATSECLNFFGNMVPEMWKSMIQFGKWINYTDMKSTGKSKYQADDMNWRWFNHICFQPNAAFKSHYSSNSEYPKVTMR